MMKASDNIIEYLKYREKFMPAVYEDEARLATIGYGHKLTREEAAGKKYKDGIDEPTAERILRSDLQWAENVVNRKLRVAVNQNQFDGLVSLCFNIGAGWFSHSTALELVNARDWAAVPAAIARFNQITKGGQKTRSRGLVERREHEGAIFSAPIGTFPPVIPKKHTGTSASPTPNPPAPKPPPSPPAPIPPAPRELGEHRGDPSDRRDALERVRESRERESRERESRERESRESRERESRESRERESRERESRERESRERESRERESRELPSAGRPLP